MQRKHGDCFHSPSPEGQKRPSVKAGIRGPIPLPTPERAPLVSVVATAGLAVLTLISPTQKPPEDCFQLFGMSWVLIYQYVGGENLVSLYRSTS